MNQSKYVVIFVKRASGIRGTQSNPCSFAIKPLSTDFETYVLIRFNSHILLKYIKQFINYKHITRIQKSIGQYSFPEEPGVRQ